ncbi:ABC transporter permease [Streptomyces oceani]|uniref:Uncharacterized protein n=1 Tax=Streptomyces oceani TaxID=1075402 RepID=A0A1E7JWN7_9ACTN|nr:ABC transporter permease subunit [Streptomyces oceani]OEU96050.1 hypothetical protein AN216_22035 [Streptomyces oceani]
MSPEPSPAAATRGGTDVIHNIGYRKYDGPRLGRSYARRSLFVHSLRGTYGLGRAAKSKVLPMILFAVMCLPALIMVASAVYAGADELPVDYTAYATFLLPVTSIFVAAVAPQVVSLDLRFKTVPLYFSRPIERSDYVAAKFGALIASLIVFTGTPVLILYVGALLGKLDFADQTLGLGQGLVFTVVFALLYGGIAVSLAALTPRRGFGVAAVIAVLTIPYMLVGALQGIAQQQGESDLTTWIGLGSPGTLLDGFQDSVLGGSSNFPGGHQVTGAEGIVYALVIAVLIAGSYALLLRRYRKAGL